MSAAPENANETCVGPASESAGKASSCDGCPNQSACASGAGKEVDPTPGIIADRLKKVKHIILVLSGKGGVGKSTFSAQLAFTLAASGRSVGLLDLDLCGPSIPRMLGLTGQRVHQSGSSWSPVWLDENLGVMSVGFMLPSEDDAVIWRGPRKIGLIKQFLTDVDWSDIEYLVLDTPPGTSDEHISIAQLLKGVPGQVGALVVTTPQEVAMSDVRKELNFCKKVGLRVFGLVENMSGFLCPCCGTKTDIFPAPRRKAGAAAAGSSSTTGAAPGGAAADASSDIGEGPAAMAARFSVPFLGAVPIDPLLLSSCESGESYVTAHPEARGVQPFLAVVKNVVRQVEGADAKVELPSDADADAEAGEGAPATVPVHAHA